MKKYKIVIFSAFSWLVIAPAITAVSCATANNQSTIVSGGSININGKKSGSDSLVWQCKINNIDISDKSFWSIEPEINNIFPKFNTEKNGVNIVWSKLEPGSYVFKLKNEYWDDGVKITSFSPTITLIISGSLNLSGGSTNIHGLLTDKDENNPWFVVYGGKDYSDKAQWSIEGSTELYDKIFVNYNSEKKGATLSWSNLRPGMYHFCVQCIFTSDSGEAFRAISDVINLSVSDSDALFLSGGTQYNYTMHSQFGRDNKPLKILLTNSGEDVTALCDFELINCVRADAISVKKDIDKAYIYWNDQIKEACIVSFYIKVKYNREEQAYPYAFWINFI